MATIRGNKPYRLVAHKKGGPQEENDAAATKKKYWTDEEDERLTELVRGFGSGLVKWKQLAAQMPEMPGENSNYNLTFMQNSGLTTRRFLVRVPLGLDKLGTLLIRIFTCAMPTRVRDGSRNLHENKAAAGKASGATNGG